MRNARLEKLFYFFLLIAVLNVAHHGFHNLYVQITLVVSLPLVFWVGRMLWWRLAAKRLIRRIEAVRREVSQRHRQVAMQREEYRSMRKKTARLVKRGEKFGLGRYVLGLIQKGRIGDVTMILGLLEKHAERLEQAKRAGVPRDQALDAALRDDPEGLRAMITKAQAHQRIRQLVNEAVRLGMAKERADQLMTDDNGDSELRDFVDSAARLAVRKRKFRSLNDQVAALPEQKHAAVIYLLEAVRPTIQKGGREYHKRVYALEKAMEKL